MRLLTPLASRIRGSIAVATSVLLLVGALTHSPVAHAAILHGSALPDTPGYDNGFLGFYNPPTTFPKRPGKLIKTQKTVALLGKPGQRESVPVYMERTWYTTTLSNGKIAPTAGVFIRHTTPFRGKGPTPLVVFATGTRGQGGQCAYSKSAGWLLTFGYDFNSAKRLVEGTLEPILNYEFGVIWDILSHGWDLFVIDYVGGAAGPQAYVNSIEAGHAMLDGARAVTQLSAVEPHTPIGFWGYSQGGGAAAAGTSLHDTYAPDVNLKGSYAGAPPLRLYDVMRTIDGTAITFALGYGINSYSKRYPSVKKQIQPSLNEHGKHVLNTLSHGCLLGSALTASFESSDKWTVDGKSVVDHLEANALFRKEIGRQLAAVEMKPGAPIMVLSNPYDDIVPYQQVKVTAAKWCKAGGDVYFVTAKVGPFPKGYAISHLAPMIMTVELPLEFLAARFAGVPYHGCTHVTKTLPLGS